MVKLRRVQHDVVGWVFGIAYGSEEAVDAAMQHDVEGAEVNSALVEDG